MADINSRLPTQDQADGATGSATPSEGILVGGTDGTNLRAISTNSSGQVNINNVSGVVSLPTGASTSANQTNGSQKTQIVDGSNTTIGAAQTIDSVNYLPAVAYSLEAYQAYKGTMFTTVFNSAALTGTTEVALIYINNPNASGKALRFYSMSFGPTLGNNYVTYRIYKDGTVTANGTAMTIVGNRQVGQASTVASAFSGPTVTANGTLIHTTVASGLTGQDAIWQINFAQILDPNHNYIITRQLSANATIGGVDIEWSEQ